MEIEILCGKCREVWPATDEYFTRRANGKFYSPCKACVQEKRFATNAVEPCCVPGCGEPRAVYYSSRCAKHLREQNEAVYARKVARKVEARI